MTNWSSENEIEKRKIDRNIPEYLRLHNSDPQDHDAWPLFTALSALDDDLLCDVKPAGKASSARVTEIKRAPKGKPSFWNRYRKSFATAACFLVAVGMVLILRQSGLLKGIADRPGDKAEKRLYDISAEPEYHSPEGQESLHKPYDGSFNGISPSDEDLSTPSISGAAEENTGYIDKAQQTSSEGKADALFCMSSSFEEAVVLWFDRNESSEEAVLVKDQFPDPKQAATYPRLMMMVMGQMPANMPRLTLERVESIVKTFDQHRSGDITAAAFQSEMARRFNEVAGAPDQLIRGADQQMTYFLNRADGVEIDSEAQIELAIEGALHALEDETRAYIRVEGLKIWYSAESDGAETLLYFCSPNVP